MTYKYLTFLLPVLTLLSAHPSYAYVGPGGGAGVIAVILGIAGAIVLGFFAVIYYPLKRLFKGRLRKNQDKLEKHTPEDDQS